MTRRREILCPREPIGLSDVKAAAYLGVCQNTSIKAWKRSLPAASRVVRAAVGHRGSAVRLSIRRRRGMISMVEHQPSLSHELPRSPRQGAILPRGCGGEAIREPRGTKAPLAA